MSSERAATGETQHSWADRLFALAAMLVLGLVVLGGVASLFEGIRTVVGWLGG